jgi:hypothetical protein
LAKFSLRWSSFFRINKKKISSAIFLLIYTFLYVQKKERWCEMLMEVVGSRFSLKKFLLNFSALSLNKQEALF